MYLLERSFLKQAALDFRVGQILVALDDDLAHLHLLFLVDDDVEDYLVLVHDVLALHYLHLGVLVTLVVEVSLCQHFGTVDHVGRYLAAPKQSELGLEVLAFRFLYAFVVDCRHARTQRQVEVQVYLVAHDRVGGNLCFREQSVAPIALHGV